jgi:hypothetical protein
MPQAGETLGNRVDWPHPGEVLAANLEPLIRRVLRSGGGLPGLVSWVRRQLASKANDGRPLSSLERESLAPDLARLLSTTLRERSRLAGTATRIGR